MTAQIIRTTILRMESSVVMTNLVYSASINKDPITITMLNHSV